jgi:tRNA (guanine26-N2/guanine27-N2)-dimethyltransferase
MEGPSITVPEGFKLHTENTSHILLPSTNEAFLNPVQEFNRDTSVACIRVWSEELNRVKEKKWKERQLKKAGGSGKKRVKLDAESETTGKAESSAEQCLAQEESAPEYRPYKVSVLEALSATGLRSIRYAKEIPLVRYVIANDLSTSAIEAMKRNVEINGLGAPKETDEAEATERTDPKRGQKLGKVRINEGDAW